MGWWIFRLSDLGNAVAACLQGNCSGVQVVNGPEVVSDDVMNRLFDTPELINARNQIDDVSEINVDGQRLIQLTFRSAGVDQVIILTPISSEDGLAFDLEGLLSAPLSVQCRVEHPDMRTLGELNECKARKAIGLQPILAREGIETLFVGGVPVSANEWSRALLAMAEHGRDQPIKVFRPGQDR